ncbi:MAG: aldehyde dehydrogenase family protein, partial [Alphaproteobacteria bacterium]
MSATANAPALPPAGNIARYDHLFIGGAWVAPEDGGVMESIDPSQGTPWAMVAYGGKRDIDKAVAAARAALDGPWGRMPGHERAALMRRFADLYKEHARTLAILETR